MNRVDAIDWLVIVVYFGLLPGVVISGTRRQQRSTDYFLTCHNVGFFTVGASIFVSKICPEHIVGLAGQGARKKNECLAAAIADFNFLYFSGVLLLISITTILALSCTAAAPRAE